MDLPFEQFPALSATGILRHAFTRRIPGINVSHDKAAVLNRLDAAHSDIRDAIDIRDWPLFTTEQIHGNNIAVVDSLPQFQPPLSRLTPAKAEATQPARRAKVSRIPQNCGTKFPGCDGIITNQRGVALGIYVADCCAVYIVDPKTPATGLVHSGRKGTELGVVTNAIKQMIDRFGSNPANMMVQLSPCIRPPHYEVDFAGEIIRQCDAVGVNKIHDSGICTACDLDRYYSYRAEKGKTGRMLALIGLTPTLGN
jgi:copper oxidase (laccase) domain-containing protein